MSCRKDYLARKRCKSLNCFDQNKTSKGLLAIGRELGLVEADEKLKFDDLRRKVGTHPASKN
jgi:hypothetical protein